MDGAEATLRSVAPEEVTSQDTTLQPLIGQKHSRCGSRSSSNQLMSLSGKNESLSPVPTLQCLRSKQQFKCVHVCLRAVSWASGHLRECVYITRTQCKPHPVRNRNRKFCSRFFKNNTLYMLYIYIYINVLSYLKSMFFYFKLYTLFSQQVKKTTMKTPVKAWCWIPKKQLQSFHPNGRAAQWKALQCFYCVFA